MVVKVNLKYYHGTEYVKTTAPKTTWVQISINQGPTDISWWIIIIYLGLREKQLEFLLNLR